MKPGGRLAETKITAGRLFQQKNTLPAIEANEDLIYVKALILKGFVIFKITNINFSLKFLKKIHTIVCPHPGRIRHILGLGYGH
ncbi:hypothetical protein LJB99_00645 [Deltaproteobacteria bacterium OttesenSCG-928-K17]|nr:hypothetical protein [Deltaproteobacteria bacterium OttesenSCG-928-K17]